MTVGELRKALEGVADHVNISLEVGDGRYCATEAGALMETADGQYCRVVTIWGQRKADVDS